MFKKLVVLAFLSFIAYVVIGGAIVSLPKMLTFEVIHAIQTLP